VIQERSAWPLRLVLSKQSMALLLGRDTCPSRVEFPLVAAMHHTELDSSSTRPALGLQIPVEDVHHTDLLPWNAVLVFRHAISFVSESFVLYRDMPFAAFVVGLCTALLFLDSINVK
jgi:hypothetical protein